MHGPFHQMLDMGVFHKPQRFAQVGGELLSDDGQILAQPLLQTSILPEIIDEAKDGQQQRIDAYKCHKDRAADGTRQRKAWWLHCC